MAGGGQKKKNRQPDRHYLFTCNSMEITHVPAARCTTSKCVDLTDGICFVQIGSYIFSDMLILAFLVFCVSCVCVFLVFVCFLCYQTLPKNVPNVLSIYPNSKLLENKMVSIIFYKNILDFYLMYCHPKYSGLSVRSSQVVQLMNACLISNLK